LRPPLAAGDLTNPKRGDGNMKKMIINFLAKLSLFNFRMSEKSDFFKKYIAIPMAKITLKNAIKDYKKGGVEAWRDFHIPLWKRCGEVRGEYIAEVMGVKDFNNARELGRVQDYEDPLVSVEGYWVVEKDDLAIKHETYCPFSEMIKNAGCPDICRVLARELENGTWQRFNPNYEFNFENLLTEGDDYCRCIHEVKKNNVK
jgi:hypothetical protein